VMGNQGDDLNNALDATDAATTGHTQVDSDAAQFNSNANTYLADNTPYLAPGWQPNTRRSRLTLPLWPMIAAFPTRGSDETRRDSARPGGPRCLRWRSPSQQHPLVTIQPVDAE
jgi:hypothetical protein